MAGIGGSASETERSVAYGHGAREPNPAALMTDLDRRFRRPLLAYFRRRVVNAAEAEDLTQDVFERLKSLSSGAVLNAEALVFSIAVNLLRDRARRRVVRGIEEPLTGENIVEFAYAFTMDLSPERFVLGQRALAEVLGALTELDEHHRAMFCLYRFESLKIREIAAIYGVSPSAVEKHVAKALYHLSRCNDSP